jgi:hypothetical protein
MLTPIVTYLGPPHRMRPAPVDERVGAAPAAPLSPRR